MAKCKRNRNKDKRDFTIKTLTANRNYKDTVFRMLFSDRKNLLSLYNAVNQRVDLCQYFGHKKLNFSPSITYAERIIS